VPLFGRVYLIPDRFDLRPQDRQMDRDNFPYTFQVDPQVVVDENISESGYTPPVDLRMLDLQTIADPLSRLREYLKVSQNGILYQIGTEKDLRTAVAVALYAADAIQNVVGIGGRPSQRNRFLQHAVSD
jgi:hypothetical protein